MASRDEVSFSRDLLNKRVVDCEGSPVGAILDVAAGLDRAAAGAPTVRRLVIRPHRPRRSGPVSRAGESLVLSWDDVEALESGHIRLRQAWAELVPSALEAGLILLRKHIMDQQVVDCRGLKLRRVNDIAMGFSDGALCLRGMDTGIRGFLTRLDDRWSLLRLFRPLTNRLPPRLISWDFVDRVEPARGHIRLRLSRDEVRLAVRRAHASAD
jgi:sporulation protein YlmC with PRC-barrel domain